MPNSIPTLSDLEWGGSKQKVVMTLPQKQKLIDQFASDCEFLRDCGVSGYRLGCGVVRHGKGGWEDDEDDGGEGGDGGGEAKGEGGREGGGLRRGQKESSLWSPDRSAQYVTRLNPSYPSYTSYPS